MQPPSSSSAATSAGRSPWPVEVTGAAPFGRRFALVDAAGRLVREPDLTAVGAFAGDGPHGPIAPAADTGGRWGYVDRAGRWVAPPIWRYAYPLDGHGFGRFQHGEGDEDGRWGYVDGSGTPVVAPRFTAAAEFRHGLAVVRTEEGPGWIDPTGVLVLSGPYEAVGPFSACGLAGARLAESGRCGYVDRSGELVIPDRFDGARPFGPDGLAGVRVGEKWGLIDRTGKWAVEPRYQRLESYNTYGLAYFIAFDEGRRYREGYLDGRGRPVLEAERRDVGEVTAQGLVRMRNDLLYGFADTTGAMVIAPQYTYADHFDPCGAAVVRREWQGQWGVLRPDGAFLAMPYREPVTDDGWPVGFDHGLGTAPFLDHDGSVVRVDPDGREVCRLEVAAPDGGSVLRIRAASGAVVWEGTAAPGTFQAPAPFLAPGREELIDHPEAFDGEVGEVAARLLAQEPRLFLARSLVFDSEDDPCELSEDDDYDLREHSWYGGMLTLASRYVSEEHWGAYDFLSEVVSDGINELADELRERLTARFGTPEEDRRFLRYGDGSHSWEWRVDGRILLLQCHWQCGDGDFEYQIWLAALDLPEDV
ncbi:WG repeat-containing protein [Streptomyces sp. NPDC047097]|uniref:WG repeat-containing protein n=1 Tax=Streptomyces sp. NPDC047097 TaxID=3155260 RepID=UPI0033CA52E4